MISLRSRLRRCCTGLALVMAMLALAGRLASGSLVVDTAVLGDLAALLDATIPCGPGAPAHTPDHHPADQGILALADDLSQPSPTLTPSLALPVPRGARLAAVSALPPARAPPAVPNGAALPRGPPVLA